jgi:hypothetical protein
MFVPVPAVALGAVVSCLVVGVVIYLLTVPVLKAIAKRVPGSRENWQRHLTAENMEKAAIVVSTFAGLLSFLLVLKLRREYGSEVWIALTVIGILASILSFIFYFAVGADATTGSGAGTRRMPSPDDGVPPRRPPWDGPAASTSGPAAEQQDYYRILLAKAMYDKSLADRLLDEERKRWPLASFDELCKRAIARLEGDNGRTGYGL